MSDRKLIFVSAAVWIAIAMYNESPAMGMVAIAGHVLYLAIHNIEVKVNKLLDHCNIHISNRD